MNNPDAPTDVVDVALVRLDPGLPVPSYAQPGDAGADLAVTSDVTLQPGERRLVGTGVAIALPDGYVGLVHPRSGLAARHGLTIVNAPGTIDAGYRGEVKVCLLNTDRDAAVTLRRGDRIAQLVIQRVSRANFVTVSELPGSVRGSDGYGSTGGMPEQPPAGVGPDGRTSSTGRTQGDRAEGDQTQSTTHRAESNDEGASSVVQQEQIP